MKPAGTLVFGIRLFSLLKLVKVALPMTSSLMLVAWKLILLGKEAEMLSVIFHTNK